jgi:hypothetical protein
MGGDGLKEGHREDYYELADQRFLGGEEFTEALKEKSNEEPIRKPKQKLIDAFQRAARAADVNPGVLSSADRGWAVSRTRSLVAYVLICRLRYKLTEVATCFRRDVATVSSSVSRASRTRG